MRISLVDHISCNGICRTCGWTASTYLANSDLINHRPEASEWDRWQACDNPKCVNHYGEGHFQDCPDWWATPLPWSERSLHQKDYLVDGVHFFPGRKPATQEQLREQLKSANYQIDNGLSKPVNNIDE